MSVENFCIEDDETNSIKELLKKFKPHKKAVYSLAISPDRKYVVTGSIDKLVKVWELKTGLAVKTLKGHKQEINSVVISNDGTLIISGSEDGTIKIWDLETGELKQDITGHEGSVFSVCIHPNDKYVISGSEDKTVKVWDVRTKRLVRTLEGHNFGVNAVAISENGKIIASSGEKTIKLWKWGQTEFEKSLEGHQFTVTSLAFSPNGQFLASGSMDKTVKIWNIETGEMLKSINGHTGGINAVAVSDDASMVASASGDNTIIVTDPENMVKYGPFKHGTYVKTVKFLQNSNLIVAGDYHGKVQIWDPTGKALSIDEILDPDNLGGSNRTCSVSVDPEKTTVFISYATVDSKKFSIAKVAQLLDSSYSDIGAVLYWEENMKDDIFEYMNDNLGLADVLIVFCSENSTNSDAVRTEWMSAYKLKKKIIPVFEKEEDIPPLLTTKLGVQYKAGNMKKFVEELHALITKKTQ